MRLEIFLNSADNTGNVYVLLIHMCVEMQNKSIEGGIYEYKFVVLMQSSI